MEYIQDITQYHIWYHNSCSISYMIYDISYIISRTSPDIVYDASLSFAIPKLWHQMWYHKLIHVWYYKTVWYHLGFSLSCAIFIECCLRSCMKLQTSYVIDLNMKNLWFQLLFSCFILYLSYAMLFKLPMSSGTYDILAQWCFLYVIVAHIVACQASWPLAAGFKLEVDISSWMVLDLRVPLFRAKSPHIY
jgi:hypothetical protein